jgi:hypothetical protein
MKLIRESDGTEPNLGDVIIDFRGDPAILAGAREPHKPGSTGRVYVRPMRSNPEHPTAEFYPSVFDLKWVDE